MRGVAVVCVLATSCLIGVPVMAQDAPPGSEQATVFKGFTVDHIQKMMQGLGLQAEPQQDDKGPYLRSGAQGQTFFVTPYDCSDAEPKICESVQFVSAVFTATQGMTADKVNDWNRKFSWARGILDPEGKPYLRNDFSTTGGVTELWFTSTLRIWINQLGKFASFTAPPE
jgi:hypothetical protein